MCKIAISLLPLKKKANPAEGPQSPHSRNDAFTGRIFLEKVGGNG